VRTFVSASILMLSAFTLVAVNTSCSGGATSSSEDNSNTECTLDDNTTATTQSTNGCNLVTRDTTSCQASRTAQGLSGWWLKFSCRVTLTKSGSNVIISTDGQPDHKSPYFETSNPCYESGFPSGRAANPNTLGSQSISVTVPFSPTADAGATGTAMSMGVVGIALNGVSIFSNAAAPGDSIYDEVATFDKCEGHPAGTKYHYHTEPTTASDTDDNFIGVMRDGFPIYGREEYGGGSPTLDKASVGAHLGFTVDSPSTNVYHYHVNYQVDGADNAYFITSGYYLSSTGACTGCN
jgi:hypothetical protein